MKQKNLFNTTITNANYALLLKDLLDKYLTKDFISDLKLQEAKKNKLKKSKLIMGQNRRRQLMVLHGYKNFLNFDNSVYETFYQKKRAFNLLLISKYVN